MSLRPYTVHSVAVVVVCACFVGASMGRADVMPVVPPAADLLLDDDEAAQSQAMVHFAQGLMLQMQSREGFEEAAKQYVLGLRCAPESRVILDHLVTPFLMQKQFEPVVDLLLPVARDYPAAARLNLVVSEALQTLGRDTESIELLHTCLTAGRWQDATVLRELFVSLWRLKRYDEIDQLLRLAQHQPGLKNHFVVEHAAAIFYSALKTTASERKRGERRAKWLDRQALKHARKAAVLVALAGRSADVESLATLFMELGRPADAASLLAAARELDVPYSPEAGILEATALCELDRADDAGLLLDGLLDDAELKPQSLPEIARIYTEAERYEDAIEVYEGALVKFPSAVSIRMQLALLYLRLEQPKIGLATLLPVKVLPPRGLRLMAHLYRQMGDGEKALATMKIAERVAIDARDADFFSVDFHLFFATLCEEEGDFDGGVEQARKALALGPDDPVACNFLGYVLADHNRSLSEADGLITKALAAQPDNEAYLDSLAWVRFRQGRFAEAHETMSAAVRQGLSHLDAVILDHAGDIAAAVGLEVLARWYWEEALAGKAPNREDVRRKLGLPDS